MDKEIEIYRGVKFIFYNNGEVRLSIDGVYVGTKLTISKEKLLELRAAIKFETPKPKEEMFNGCDND